MMSNFVSVFGSLRLFTILILNVSRSTPTYLKWITNNIY